MDVRQYYRKLREVESGIVQPYVLVTSLEQSDGGKPGVISEVTREQAAKLLVEGRATLSTEVEEKGFFARRVSEKKAIEKADIARRLQVTIVSAPDDVEPKATSTSNPETGSKK